MSLKDPVSTVKIGIPCRSTLCTHNRCFDAECFLQLQEQAPTWQCPICNKTISFEALAVDEYVQEILDTAPKDTDQVTIEPDGRWSLDKDHAANDTNGYGDEDSDEDLVEITDFRLSAIKSEAAHTPQSLATPPLASREASSAPRTGQKRSSDYIDLTLSDDDEPPRPAKKVAYSTPSSLPEPSRGYQGRSYPRIPSVPMRPQAPSRQPSSSHYQDAPSPPQPPSYGSYRPQPPPPTYPQYPRQGSSSYPTYIGSSP
jgi:E3 SUMO-protein ligase PIAS1